MNTEDKAKHLVDKFYNTEHCEMNMLHAKQCAVLAVDEIINVVSDVSKIRYWLSVKNHIKNL